MAAAWTLPDQPADAPVLSAVVGASSVEPLEDTLPGRPSPQMVLRRPAASQAEEFENTFPH